MDAKTVVIRCLTASAVWLVFFSCSKDPLEPSPNPDPVPSVGLDEPLLITASTTQVPVLSNQDQHTFELAPITLVQTGEYNDIEFQYTTNDACDEDVEVFNFTTNGWDRIASGPWMACSPVITNWWRTLSEWNFTPENYVNDGGQLVMRTSADPSLRILKLNARHDPIALPPLDIEASGIRVLGSTIWLASDDLSRITIQGASLPSLPAPADPCCGLAWDGERFWTIDRGAGPVEVFCGITPLGVTECTFDGHHDFAVNDGLVCVDSLLWAVRSGGDELLGIDLALSSTTGSIEFPERLFLATGGAVALAHDGTDFYVAYESSIKKVSMSGVELEDHPLTVERVVDLAWVEGALWILHTGPRGVRAGGQFVSKFDL
jgi:hypothetical protein